ncbi:hypothetical protein EDC01DRAFT_753370 [Geopyxis carbonaria]|nr:hypothetical protein EDC01DRAFT_753370 [Geopyxis carbonaria]
MSTPQPYIKPLNPDLIPQRTRKRNFAVYDDNAGGEHPARPAPPQPKPFGPARPTPITTRAPAATPAPAPAADQALPRIGTPNGPAEPFTPGFDTEHWYPLTTPRPRPEVPGDVHILLSACPPATSTRLRAAILEREAEWDTHVTELRAMLDLAAQKELSANKRLRAVVDAVGSCGVPPLEGWIREVERNWEEAWRRQQAGAGQGGQQGTQGGQGGVVEVVDLEGDQEMAG